MEERQQQLRKLVDSLISSVSAEAKSPSAVVRREGSHVVVGPVTQLRQDFIPSGAAKGQPR